MEFRLHCKSSVDPSPARPAFPLLSSLQTATELDRQILGEVMDRFERQVRWNRRSLAVGVALGTMAAVVALFAGQTPFRWPLLTAATLELVCLPYYSAVACRRLRRFIASIRIDLKSGLVADGEGRVRSLLGVGRLIQDSQTRRLRFVPAELTELADWQSGAIVAYRFALRSGVALGGYSPEREQAPSASQESCSATLSR